MATMNRKPDPAPEPVYSSLIASAARMPTKMQVQSISGRDQAWQETAYQMYDEVGEFRYACDWVGSMMSKAILFPTLKTDDVVAPVMDGKAKRYVDNLFNDDDGKAEMLRLIGVHMTIAGECFLIGYDNPDPFGDEEYLWEVASPTGIRRVGGGGKWQINNEIIDVDPEDVLVIRIWRPHPKDNRFAVSPAKPLLPVLGEILRLTQHVAAQVDSRLAGAGILLMPNEMTFPPPPEAVADGDTQAIQHHANDAESLMKTIVDAMSTSIKDRASASALVPIVITAPADAIESAKHMTFWSELDRQAIDLRTEAIRRLALGMDMPPEVLQGNADTNHWAAWQADESAIKAHTEPLLKIITSALSRGYLRPLLKDAGIEWEELRKYSIGADTADMRLRPNRSKEALELYDRGVVSEETLRREAGFAPEDAMNKEQKSEWFRDKVASGSTTPDLVESALESLGALGGPTTSSGSADAPNVNSEETQEARPTPTLKGHPERALPDEQKNARHRENRRAKEQNTMALTAAAEQLTIRAFERAGNKLKNRMQTKPRVPAAELYSFVDISSEDTQFLLEDAWTHLPPVAERYDVPVESLTAALENYAQDSLVNAKPHSYERLEAHLEESLSREQV